MNKTKISNPVRLIAFFLTAVILICTFGFTVDGWQVESKAVNLPLYEDRVENSSPIVNEDIKPIFINPLTGLNTTEDVTASTPFGIVMESCEGAYGISYADILVEIPIENEKTRLVSLFTSTSQLWKVGSITSTRGYISNILKYFGAIAIYNGCDDKIVYESCDISNASIDLSLSDKFWYSNHLGKIYTSSELISAPINSLTNQAISLPYDFCNDENEKIKFSKIQREIKILSGEDSIVELKFDEEKQKYIYYKNGNKIFDVLNGNVIEFTNCLVLFADSVTYDNSNGSQFIMDTIGSGVGYYFTEGTYSEIKWSAGADGKMTFIFPTGEILTINRGNIYINFIKSSRKDDLIFT